MQFAVKNKTYNMRGRNSWNHLLLKGQGLKGNNEEVKLKIQCKREERLAGQKATLYHQGGLNTNCFIKIKLQSNRTVKQKLFFSDII